MVDKTPAQITPGTPSRGSVVHASDAAVTDLSRSHAEEDISRLQSAVIDYNPTLTYEIGDFALESGSVYRCIVAIAVPEAFNTSKWTVVSQTPWASDIDGAAFDLLNSGFLEQNEISEPATPASGLLRLWSESDAGFSVLKYQGNSGLVNTISEDIFVAVRNRTGVTLDKGKVVYVTGAQGQRVTVDLAKADSDSTMRAIGFLIADLSNNSNGFVKVAGTERNVNTNAFTAGDTLYVSETTAGEVTATKPVHPNISQIVGFVLVSSPSSGELTVVPGDTNGQETGTNKNTYLVGDSMAGTKTVGFVNDFTANLDWNPTAARTQTLQDATGTIALLSDTVAPFEGSEIADPPAPATNNGILYFRDNGAGKTELAVRFPTGAVQVIATEP